MKKKAIAAAAALALMLGLFTFSGGTALAHAPVSDAAPAAESGAEEDTFGSWLDEGMGWLRGAYTEGKNAVIEGTKWLTENLPKWSAVVEEYLDGAKSSPEVMEAWNTLRSAAEQAGKVSVETAQQAYRTVRDWLAENAGTSGESVLSALDRMAAAAGVKEAAVSEWYRTVERFVTENAAELTESAAEAWRQIKDANGEGATLAKEEIREAYTLVRDWLAEFGTEGAAAAEEALGYIREELEAAA